MARLEGIRFKTGSSKRRRQRERQKEREKKKTIVLSQPQPPPPPEKTKKRRRRRAKRREQREDSLPLPLPLPTTATSGPIVDADPPSSQTIVDDDADFRVKEASSTATIEQESPQAEVTATVTEEAAEEGRNVAEEGGNTAEGQEDEDGGAGEKNAEQSMEREAGETIVVFHSSRPSISASADDAQVSSSPPPTPRASKVQEEGAVIVVSSSPLPAPIASPSNGEITTVGEDASEETATKEDEPIEDVEVEPHARAKSITDVPEAPKEDITAPEITDVHEAPKEDIVTPEITAIVGLPTPPPSQVSRESKERSQREVTTESVGSLGSAGSRKTIIQVVIETPRRTPVSSTTRVTRSSARTRLAPESPTPQEEQTPLTRKRKRTQSSTPAELESPYPFKARSRKDALEHARPEEPPAEDVGPEEPPTEVVVTPDVIIEPAVVTPEEAPPPTKRRRSTRKLETVSPYFPVPPTQEVVVPVKQTRARKNATTSPYFSGASPEKKGRVPKGISAIPWPPFTASKFGLIQEELAEKPFHLLVATVFLNKTKGSVAKPILWQFLDLYPTPEILSNASQEDIEELIRPLGLQRTRAERLIKMGKEWLANPPVADAGTVKYNYPPKNTKPFPIEGREPHGVVQKLPWEISHIPGVGAYALDSWRIFCRDRLRGVPQGVEEEWKRVVPNDKELRAYCRWRWAQEGERWEEEGDGWGADAGDNVDANTAAMDALRVAMKGMVRA